MQDLDDSNFILYAAANYDNPLCYDTDEFYDDLKRFKYLKRLFNRYRETGELKERLIINHIIVIYNVFSPVAATRLLFFKLSEYHSMLKPFLMLNGMMPDIVVGIYGKNIRSTEISLDSGIVEALRKL